MRFRTFFLFLLLAITALFALVNWPAFTAPTTLSLFFTTVTAPLGLIMLGVVFVLGALSIAYLIYVQGSALRDARRHAREMDSQRQLADNAETSRFTELHGYVGGELRRMEQLHADTRAQIMTRLDQFEQRMRLAMQDAGRTHTTVIERDIERDDADRRSPNGGSEPTAHH